MIDIKKRKKIMERSVRLGHCICNPKQRCPCMLFKEKNICLCAGERPEEGIRDVPLTEFAENAGCASKISQGDLKKILGRLPKISDPRVLVGTNTCDDAGVYRLTDEIGLVQTVDVFTPNVDDPYTFGQVAAANSVSDIYAMGGIPLTALSIIGFPIEKLSHRIMNRILRGGMDKLQEAGAVVIGGHSIKDGEIKFGFAVTGIINPKKIIYNAGAGPGDVLILTKPLGTGVLSFARQLGKASAQTLKDISLSMVELNKTSSELMVEMGVSAATDVTGFGLLGHLTEMAIQSGVAVEVYAESVPLFDNVLECLGRGMISGAIERNREYASQYVKISPDVGEAMEYALYDPQTSGGLLIALPEDKASLFINRLKRKKVRRASVIGRVISKSKAGISVKKNR